MKYAKKSLGQNFLIDKNVIRKIINLTQIENKNILEIGPGKGALTEEILLRKPKSLIVVEKDKNLAIELRNKFSSNKLIKIFNNDILKFNLENVITKNFKVFGNLPYNISSQILVKILKLNSLSSKIDNLIFMFQKELGEKIIGKFPSKNYGRLSIISGYKLNILEKFIISSNCFFPKPKVNSMIIHFKPKIKNLYKINKINNLEKITNLLFSNKRKMINKNIKKILDQDKIKKISGLKINLRPSDISPEIYYKSTELFEKN